jgi:hypothetical protein
MRKLLNTVDRVQKDCQANSAELAGLRSQHERQIGTTSQVARSKVDALAISNIAEVLLSRLNRRGPPDSEPQPIDIFEAKREFDTLAARLRVEVGAYLDRQIAWEAKTFKRTKNRPELNADIPPGLSRLVTINRAAPGLRDAYVRETVEDETERLRSAFNSEGRRIAAGQAELFSSLSEVVLEVDTQAGRSGSPWTDKRWNDVTPTVSMQSCIRMGSLELRLPSFAGIKTIPMLMQCPPKSNLVFIAGVEQRQSAIDLIRSQIFRLLSAIPPGAVEFIVFDPVALGQSVADFRHLAEYDQRLVDTKTWTSEQDIERRLSELSAHLETVISNYLRGQFETIAQYNSYAGEVAEPYRILVVFDFPSGFSDSAAATLQSIMENGPRCGLHTILLSDPAGFLGERQLND